MMETAFTRLMGCQVPIQQAPMGAVSSPELAVAVADAGGVGTITALGPAEHLDGLLADMSKHTGGVLAANFLTADLDRDVLAAAVQRVRLIDFLWVDPDPRLVEVARGAGTLVRATWPLMAVVCPDTTASITYWSLDTALR